MNDLKGIIEDCNKSDLVSDKIIKKIIEIIGQEEWQDLHDENNDICTTMGELIITLKRIADLEKENAELKAKNKWYSEQVCNKECAEVWENLTKAKEIIRELFHYIPSWTGEGNDKPRVYAMPDELRAKAEKFLKDSEGK